MTTRQQYFDGKFRRDDDPWRCNTSWYERRKRALALAALPRERFSHGFEPGCGHGALSAELAARCDRLLCSDFSPRAVELTRHRLMGIPGTRVEQLEMPEHWPPEQFDLIVISELAYYLAPRELASLVEHMVLSLTDDGYVLSCHWRYPMEAWAQTADDISNAFRRPGLLHRIVEHVEPDFILELWSKCARSVAQWEGLV